jgi:predicted small metal-binding protein
MTISKVIECPCGAVIEDTDQDELVEAAQIHAKTVHDMDLSRDQALSMARPI